MSVRGIPILLLGTLISISNDFHSQILKKIVFSESQPESWEGSWSWNGLEELLEVETNPV